MMSCADTKSLRFLGSDMECGMGVISAIITWQRTALSYAKLNVNLLLCFSRYLLRIEYFAFGRLSCLSERLTLRLPNVEASVGCLFTYRTSLGS